MNDLIIGSASIALGIAGLIAIHAINRRLPAHNARMARLRRAGIVHLHARLTGITGEIMTCARQGRYGAMLRAWLRMLPVMLMLHKKESDHAAT